MITTQDLEQMDNKVCDLLSMNKEELFWLKLEVGCKFLERWIGEDHADKIKAMQQLPDFWAWWKQLWFMYDRNFTWMYKANSPDFDMDDYRRQYEYFHRPDRVTHTPNSAIIRSYQKMIKEMPSKVLG